MLNIRGNILSVWLKMQNVKRQTTKNRMCHRKWRRNSVGYPANLFSVLLLLSLSPSSISRNRNLVARGTGSERQIYYFILFLFSNVNMSNDTTTQCSGCLLCSYATHTSTFIRVGLLWRVPFHLGDIRWSFYIHILFYLVFRLAIKSIINYLAERRWSVASVPVVVVVVVVSVGTTTGENGQMINDVRRMLRRENIYLERSTAIHCGLASRTTQPDERWPKWASPWHWDWNGRKTTNQ